MADVQENAGGEVSYEAARAEWLKQQNPESSEAESTEDAATEDAQSGVNAEDETDSESAAEKETDDQEHEEEEQEGEEEDQPKPRKGGFQRRIEKLNARNAAKDVEIAELRRQLASGAKPEPKQEATPAADDKEPEPGEAGHENETVAQYNKRLVKWQLKQEQKATAEAEAKKTAKARQDEATKAWDAKKASARAQFDDFDEALEDFKGQVSRVMSEFLMDSEVGGHVAYYLATHADEAAKIAEMGTARAAAALTKIEAQFAKKQDSADTPARRQTQAPPPVRPVRRAAPAASAEPSDSDDMDTWLRKRNAQIARERGGR